MEGTGVLAAWLPDDENWHLVGVDRGGILPGKELASWIPCYQMTEKSIQQ